MITSLILWMQQHKQLAGDTSCGFAAAMTLNCGQVSSGFVPSRVQAKLPHVGCGLKSFWQLSHQSSSCGINLPCSNLFMQPVIPSANFQGLAEDGWKVYTSFYFILVFVIKYRKIFLWVLLFFCLSSFEYKIGVVQFSDSSSVIAKLIRNSGAEQLSSSISYQ